MDYSSYTNLRIQPVPERGMRAAKPSGPIQQWIVASITLALLALLSGYGAYRLAHTFDPRLVISVALFVFAWATVGALRLR